MAVGSNGNHRATQAGAWAALAVLATQSLGCAAHTPRAPMSYRANMSFDGHAKHVLLVSFDGMRSDVVTPERTPQIHSLQEAGASATMALAVVPSITLVNHASMVTGVGPAKHHIDWNSYLPDRGPVTVPTVFELAKSAGFKTALVAGKEKFHHLDRPGTIDRLVIEEGSPQDVATAANQIIREQSPELLMVHFRHPDTEGHAHGWLSDQQLDAIKEADNALGWILATLNETGHLSDTQIIVTADHGGEGSGHGSDKEIDRHIPWVAAGAGVTVHGAIAKTVNTFDTAATAAVSLGLTVPAGWNWDGTAVF